MKRLLWIFLVVLFGFLVSVVDAADYTLTVQPGQFLIGLVREAGLPDKNYIDLVIANPQVWSDTSWYHSSHDLVPTGITLVIPEYIAQGLGMVAPVVVNPSSPVVTQPTVQAVVSGASHSFWRGVISWFPLVLGGLMVLAILFLWLHEYWKATRGWLNEHQVFEMLRPAHAVGQPVVAGGISTPAEAAGLLRSQARQEESGGFRSRRPDSQQPQTGSRLVQLRPCRIWGRVEVAGADNQLESRLIVGQRGWEGTFADGRVLYTLSACGNPLYLGLGNRFSEITMITYLDHNGPVSVPQEPVVAEPEPRQVAEEVATEEEETGPVVHDRGVAEYVPGLGQIVFCYNECGRIIRYA